MPTPRTPLVKKLQPLIWPAFAAVGALTVLVALASVLPLAVEAGSAVNELRRLSSEDLVATDSKSLDELLANIDSVRSKVRSASRRMQWFARFSPALAWLPGLDQELTAWAAQAARSDSMLESASDLLHASSQLLDGFDDIQGALVDSQGTSLPSASSFESLEPTFAATIESVTQASEAGRKYTPALLFARAGNTLSLIEDLEDRMAIASAIGRQASGLLVELLQIGGSTEALMSQLVVDEEEPEPLSVEALRSTLAQLDEDLQFARVRADGLASLVAGTDLEDSLLGELGLLQEVLGVLLVVNRGTMVGLDAIEAAVNIPGESGASLLGDDGAVVRILDGVLKHGDEIEESLNLLETARVTVGELKSRGGRSQYLRGLDDLESVASLLSEGLQLLRDIAPIGAKLLGRDSTQRYLVLGQSADELRATGGFVSAVWTVTFEGGALTEVKYHDVVRVDSAERLVLYPPAPAGLEQHMFAHVWLLRDVSWEPDFPTTAQAAADMFKLGQEQEVDGVVALNQWSLLSFVEGLGSIPSPAGGEPITPRNLLAKLERESDEHGRAYMDLALQGILDHLAEPMTLRRLMRLTSAAYGSLKKRDLLLFLYDPELQSVIEDNGWDGRVRQEPTDYLYVVDSNVGWSKVDRNIERTVRYRVDLTKEPRPRISLTLGYNNHGGPSSPSCDPQWFNEDHKYPNLKNACYWNFWRVYLPLGTRLLSSTPLPLPEYSVSVLVGKGQPGEDTLKISSEYNRTIFSGLFALEAGDEEQVNLVYDLPPSLQNRNDGEIEYNILLQKQPGIRRRDVLVEFTLPEGYRLASSSVAPAFSGNSRVTFSLRIEEDTMLDTVFTRDPDDAG